MATAQNVFDLVRFNIKDPNTVYWTNVRLLEPVKSAYREVQRRFASDNVRFTNQEVILSGGTTFTAGLTKLDRTTTPALPSDFLQPERIKEKPAGSSVDNYTEVLFVTNGLPDRAPEASLNQFDWYAGSIWFVGATTDRDLQIEYVRGFTDIVDGTTAIPFDDIVDPMAELATALVFDSRGDIESATVARAKAARYLEDAIGIHISTQQRIPRRRKPFRGY